MVDENLHLPPEVVERDPLVSPRTVVLGPLPIQPVSRLERSEGPNVVEYGSDGRGVLLSPLPQSLGGDPAVVQFGPLQSQTLPRKDEQTAPVFVGRAFV